MGGKAEGFASHADLIVVNAQCRTPASQREMATSTRGTMATAKRDAAAERTPPTAKRGRIGERMWSDVRRAARLAREEGVQLRVRHDGSVDIIGVAEKHTACRVPDTASL